MIQKKINYLQNVADQFSRHQMGSLSLIVIIFMIIMALLAPFISPYSPIEIGVGHFMAPPNTRNWFGTDELGRDVFSRVLHGASVSLRVIFTAVFVALLFGTVLGAIAGYLGGIWDLIIMRFTDAMLAFPAIILALTIVAWLGPSLLNTTIAISIIKVSSFARLVRGEVLAIRNVDFIRAAQLIGSSHIQIIFRHIFPNVIGSVIVFGSLTASQALIIESGLSFLGLGAQPPEPSWGLMIATGIDFTDAGWMSLFPGGAIFIVILSLNFLGDAVRDLLDFRLMGSKV